MKTRLLALLVLMAACGPMIDVRSDYDPSADFAHLQTYAWLQQPSSAPRDPRIHNDLLDSRVHSAVNDALHAKGYTEASENPDFRVAYQVVLREKVAAAAFPTSYGYGLGRLPADSDVRIATYDEGTLLLDVVDGNTNELIWRGAASTRIDPDRTPQERTALIRAAVNEMLGKFPPKPKQ
jgi:hypothetical protein